MWKSNVGDYPLQVRPCEHWFVRYAVCCTYFSDKQEEMLKAYKEYIELPTWDAHGGNRYNREIWLGGYDDEFLLDKDSELYKKINSYIAKYDDHDADYNIKWCDCPFEELDQSACPFYKESKWNADVPLEELRAFKGYEV